MQAERHNAVSRDLRVTIENHTGPRANQHAGPDTRRYAGIFPLEVPEAVVDCGDATHEAQNDYDDLDKNASTTQLASGVGEISPLSAAQQIIACYRVVHDSDHAPESTATGIEEKTHSQIPDDQRSMYTLATSADTPLTMDMMWKPKPKVHMRHTDQQALLQAQNQAITMMHNAGLKLTNKIQCRRRGCADILPNVEALKYHLHIHNIADFAVKSGDPSPSVSRKHSLVERSTTPNSKTHKRRHSRSKSSFGLQQKCSMTSHLPRKLSTGSLLPSLSPSREGTPEIWEVPSFTTVAKTLTPDPSPIAHPANLPPVHDDETPSTRSSTPSRGRRTRKKSMAVSAGAECIPSITRLFSASSPIMYGRLALTPHRELPLAPGPATHNESDNSISIPNKSMHPVSDKFTGSQNPVRALSPTRVMSPIRNGIRRILSIGYPENVVDK